MLALKVESWIWYGVVSAIVLARLASRSLHFGSILRLRADDFLMFFALCFYTTEIVTMNIIVNSQTNLFPPDYLQTHTLTTAEIANRTYGSKVVLVIEQCQCCTIWLVKACLLIMYHHLTVTSFPTQNLIVTILSVYVVFGFVFMEIFYFAVWCRPFHDYWAVPTPNVQCSAATDHLITNVVFNLSSDVILLCVALPMFLRTTLPLKRKLAICCVFGLGVFVILSAVLNKYYSFEHPFGSEWTYWYIRESSTAVLVANLPFTWNLVRKLFGDTDPAEVERSRTTSSKSSRLASTFGWSKRFRVIRGRRADTESGDITATSRHSHSESLQAEKGKSVKSSQVSRMDDPLSLEQWEEVYCRSASSQASQAECEEVRRPSKVHMTGDVAEGIQHV